MSLGSSRELAENKLILLYIIDKLNMPVSNPQLTKIVLDNRFMNYFLLQQFLNELCESNLLLSSESDEKVFYTITQGGKQTLSYFINLIPAGIKIRIDESVSAIRKRIKTETHITADYTPESENEYMVSCKVSEDDFTLMEVKVMVGTKKDARDMCENWKSNSQAIYTEILESLLKHRDKQQ
ncbi:MAG: DUF4364 family protein [Clostridia bacterium]|nr:DUF4364 family protein [Clostridia bacterium]